MRTKWQFEESVRQLRVCEGQGPQTQVRGSVRHGTEDKLYRLNHLMDKEAAEAVVVERHLHSFERLLNCLELFRRPYHHFLLGTHWLLLVLLIFHQFSILIIDLDDAIAGSLAIHADELDVALLVEPRPFLPHQEEQWLGTKHYGHADHHGKEEQERVVIHRILRVADDRVTMLRLVVVAEGEDGCDHDIDDTRRFLILKGSDASTLLHGGAVIDIVRLEKLRDDQRVHPAKEAPKDHATGDDLGQEFQVFALVEHVRALAKYTEAHVQHTKDN